MSVFFSIQNPKSKIQNSLHHLLHQLNYRRVRGDDSTLRIRIQLRAPCFHATAEDLGAGFATVARATSACSAPVSPAKLFEPAYCEMLSSMPTPTSVGTSDEPP